MLHSHVRNGLVSSFSNSHSSDGIGFPIHVFVSVRACAHAYVCVLRVCKCACVWRLFGVGVRDVICGRKRCEYEVLLLYVYGP